jgi:hypothetical protein
MASSFIRENLKLISTVLCIIGLLLMILSQAVSWFELDADKNVGGIADINLKADFYESGVNFKATAHVEAGAVGGLIGGIVDIGGVMDRENITIEDEIKYWEGIERFQGMVGVLFDTTKNADYTVNPQTWNSTNTKIYVNTHTDIIPWWPEGLAQDITITVRLNQTDNVKNVRIDRVWIDIYKDWNETSRKYESLAEKAWEIEPGDFLYKKGDQKVYRHGVAVDRKWGDKIGIIAKIDLTLTDNLDQTQYTILEPFPEDSHPQKMVNVIPLPQGQFISVILMFMAFPLTVISIILTIVAIIFTYLDKKRRAHLMLSAAILEFFAVIFFVNGANTLLNLIEFLTEEDFSWNVLGLLIPTLAAVFILVAFLLQVIYRPKEEEEEEEEKEIKFDISAAISEEEAEGGEELEVEEFECPQCGKEFTEMVPACPECGAEFEGVDEEDEEAEEEEGAEAEEEEEKEEEARED